MFDPEDPERLGEEVIGMRNRVRMAKCLLIDDQMAMVREVWPQVVQLDEGVADLGDIVVQATGEQLQGNGEALIEPPTPARPPQLAQTVLPQCPCPNRWVPFIRCTGAMAVAQGRSHNTQHQTRQKRRTTDAGPRTTAPRKTSIPDHKPNNSSY